MAPRIRCRSFARDSPQTHSESRVALQFAEVEVRPDERALRHVARRLAATLVEST
jgi:hypothetical protein